MYYTRKRIGDTDWSGIAVKVGIAFGAYELVVKPLLQKIGLQPTAADNTVAKETVTQGTPFDPKFYQSQSHDTTIMTLAQAQTLATRLFNDMGLFGDGNSDIIALFRSLQTQAQVSFLAAIFQQMYNGDLLTWLKQGTNTFFWNGLSSDDIATIINLVNALPNT